MLIKIVTKANCIAGAPRLFTRWHTQKTYKIRAKYTNTTNSPNLKHHIFLHGLSNAIKLINCVLQYASSALRTNYEHQRMWPHFLIRSKTNYYARVIIFCQLPIKCNEPRFLSASVNGLICLTYARVMAAISVVQHPLTFTERTKMHLHPFLSINITTLSRKQWQHKQQHHKRKQQQQQPTIITRIMCFPSFHQLIGDL